MESAERNIIHPYEAEGKEQKCMGNVCDRKSLQQNAKDKKQTTITQLTLIFEKLSYQTVRY